MKVDIPGVGGLSGGGIQQKRKISHGPEQQYGNARVGREWLKVEEYKVDKLFWKKYNKINC